MTFVEDLDDKSYKAESNVWKSISSALGFNQRECKCCTHPYDDDYTCGGCRADDDEEKCVCVCPYPADFRIDDAQLCRVLKYLKDIGMELTCYDLNYESPGSIDAFLSELYELSDEQVDALREQYNALKLEAFIRTYNFLSVVAGRSYGYSS